VSGQDGRYVRGVGSARALLASLVLLLPGCGIPVPQALPDTTDERGVGAGGGSAVDRLVPSDDLTRPLTDQLELIADRIVEVREALDATGPGSADEALGLILGTVSGGPGPGLLPAIAPDRAEVGSDDLVTALIALAGETGGERGRLVLELVRDPMLGDLGAWQRDPVGIITLLRSIADTAEDPSTLDSALLDLPGELTRTLGYVLAIAATDDADLVAHATRQASGRLGVVLVSIELAIQTLTRGVTDRAVDGTDGRRESAS
jgi:hypothetical protein